MERQRKIAVRERQELKEKFFQLRGERQTWWERKVAKKNWQHFGWGGEIKWAEGKTETWKRRRWGGHLLLGVVWHTEVWFWPGSRNLSCSIYYEHLLTPTCACTQTHTQTHRQTHLDGSTVIADPHLNHCRISRHNSVSSQSLISLSLSFYLSLSL